MIAYIAAGFDPDGFGWITPRQYEIRMRGAIKREEWERNKSMSQAWHTAAMTRAKRLPPLKSLLILPPEPKRRRQSWQEQNAIMAAWAKAHNARLEANAKGR